MIYEKLGLHWDQIGVNWIYDKTNQVYWHNGVTGNYNGHLCFDPKSKIAIVVLSNQKPFYRIPATIIGHQLFKEINKISNMRGRSYIMDEYILGNKEALGRSI